MNKNYEEWGATGRGSMFENKVGDLRNLRDLEALTTKFSQSIGGKKAPVSVEKDDKAELMSLIDKETILYSPSHFKDTLEYEVNRAQRYRRHLSICIVSLDNMDEISSSLGSSGFKYVISSLARVFKNTLRGVDFPARFTEGSFVVIMPETSAEGTTTVAERLRAKFKSTQLSFSGKEVPLRCSVGCACFPAHAKTAQYLIDSAVRSLETAQQRGGDMVCML
jgi:diguanylate cyclase (GGDEF)-like protein